MTPSSSSLWICYSIADGNPLSAGPRNIHGGRHLGAERQFWRRELHRGTGAVLRQGVQPGVQTRTASPAAADAGLAIHPHSGAHRPDSHRSPWHTHLQAGSLGHRSSGLFPIWTCINRPYFYHDYQVADKSLARPGRKRTASVKSVMDRGVDWIG